MNIGSILGIVALPVHGAYAATKMALEAFTDALRREMSLFGVRVAMVNPGAITTNIVEKVCGSLCVFVCVCYDCGGGCECATVSQLALWFCAGG